MTKIKKICFYSYLSSGHLNVCASLATVLLDRHSDKLEIFFLADQEWQEKLSKIDGRFKFVIVDQDKQATESIKNELMDKFEQSLSLPLVERMLQSWGFFLQEADNPMYEFDLKAEAKIRELKPDFLLCDQLIALPTMQLAPYAFLCSANPLLFGFQGYPKMGCDARVDEKEKIQQFDDRLAEVRVKTREVMGQLYEKRQAKLPSVPIEQPISERFNIFVYPQELDYYRKDEELKSRYQLWQVDSPLSESRVPKPFELPEEFAKQPGKIVYLSLGTVFSYYAHYVQKIVDALDRLPSCKFIVSMGVNGDRVKLPSARFYGENFLNQLAVLQVADLMIGHGGCNSLNECFHFGVPQIIMPFTGDQINNAARVEETGYGYRLDPMSFTHEQLVEVVNKALANEELRSKMKKASERIRKDQSMQIVADQVADYISKL